MSMGNRKGWASIWFNVFRTILMFSASYRLRLGLNKKRINFNIKNMINFKFKNHISFILVIFPILILSTIPVVQGVCTGANENNYATDSYQCGTTESMDATASIVYQNGGNPASCCNSNTQAYVAVTVTVPTGAKTRKNLYLVADIYLGSTHIAGPAICLADPVSCVSSVAAGNSLTTLIPIPGYTCMQDARMVPASGQTKIIITWETANSAPATCGYLQGGHPCGQHAEYDAIPITHMSVSLNPKTICEDPSSTTTLTATVSNPCSAIHYAWYRLIGGTYQLLSDGTKYTGTTSTSLVIHGPVAADSGLYKINAYCGTCDPLVSGFSAEALLTVNPLPIVLISPASKNVCAGDSATFTALIGAGYTCPSSGTISYLWYRGSVAPANLISAGGHYTLGGTNGNMLTISNPDTTYSGTYISVATCSSTGCQGQASATLTVDPLPPVLVSPATQEVCSGISATFTASIGAGYTCPSSGTISYQWYRGSVAPANLISAGGHYTLGGTNGNMLTISNPDTTYSGTYISVATCSSTGCQGQASAILTVDPLPSVSINPPDQEACVGTSATFTASSAGCSQATYKWYIGSISPANLISSGGQYALSPNGDTLTISALTTTNEGTYIVVATCETGCEGQSGAEATLAIVLRPIAMMTVIEPTVSVIGP